MSYRCPVTGTVWLFPPTFRPVFEPHWDQSIVLFGGEEPHLERQTIIASTVLHTSVLPCGVLNRQEAWCRYLKCFIRRLEVAVQYQTGLFWSVPIWSYTTYRKQRLGYWKHTVDNMGWQSTTPLLWPCGRGVKSIHYGPTPHWPVARWKQFTRYPTDCSTNRTVTLLEAWRNVCNILSFEMRAKKIYLRPSYHIRLDCIDWLLFVSVKWINCRPYYDANKNVNHVGQSRRINERQTRGSIMCTDVCCWLNVA